jgi:hypothetical protein
VSRRWFRPYEKVGEKRHKVHTHTLGRKRPSPGFEALLTTQYKKLKDREKSVVTARNQTTVPPDIEASVV